MVCLERGDGGTTVIYQRKLSPRSQRNLLRVAGY